MAIWPFWPLWPLKGLKLGKLKKNKATFITEPKKVFIVKVPLFLQFEHV